MLDDANILSEEILLRRVNTKNPNMWKVDFVTGKKRVSSAAFAYQNDGVSVYREKVLRNFNLVPKDILLKPTEVVLGIQVENVRSCTCLGVRDDPWPQGIQDEYHLRNAAHALIVGWNEISTSARKKYQRYLATKACIINT
jgi:hypothetical protein